MPIPSIPDASAVPPAPKNPRSHHPARRGAVPRARRVLTALLAGSLGAASLTAAVSGTPAAQAAVAPVTAPQLVPLPQEMSLRSGQSFTLSADTRIVAAQGALAVAQQLAAVLRPSTGYALPVSTGAPQPGTLALALDGATSLGDEGYTLESGSTGVVVRAHTAHGAFNGVQTLRQLLPAWVESPTVRPGPWTVPGVSITDEPRFGYRGAMLDIARHFQTVDTVKRIIDEISMYKINTLHLHLADDQGWRIAINGRPELTTIGAQFGIDNSPGGYWTQAEYVDVVQYAASRFVTIVPEIDTPGHTNAAIMAYADIHPDINCSANKPPRWNLSGDVGYSALCPDSPNTWALLTDVINQLSALTPGPYYHIGGDEVPTTILTQQQYADFINREAPIVGAAGKIVMGWNEISEGDFGQPGMPQGVVQFWGTGGTGSGGDSARRAVQKGMKVVMSPADRAYVDQKYVTSRTTNPNGPVTPIGLNWACPRGCDVDTAYNWDPATLVPARTTSTGEVLPAVTESDVIGVEGALWSETVKNLSDAEYLYFPRLPAIAELGWSPAGVPGRTFDEFKVRLAAQGARWTAMGVNFYPSPLVPWRADLTAADVNVTNTYPYAVSGQVATLALPALTGTPGASPTATIDWGDGTTSTATLTGTPGVYANTLAPRVNSLYAVSASHTYAGPGHYTATLTVTAGATTTSITFAVTAASITEIRTALSSLRASGGIVASTYRDLLDIVSLAQTAEAGANATAVSGYVQQLRGAIGALRPAKISAEGKALLLELLAQWPPTSAAAAGTGVRPAA
ncbi:family 20 glycosylhydrolase [Motilibacter deserti]|uniref:beta-N-acetylhexosaminidase n=1 Tax=Motilibacter deserti TaxID=2714956 RepID=A0ABX0GUE4_9ACTN|nr:family 20 glycosylhydrolase [Motilibacter deserti]NHC13336.1 family 20 glycosylhydrolase [Motilibacter deserti]